MFRLTTNIGGAFDLYVSPTASDRLRTATPTQDPPESLSGGQDVNLDLLRYDPTADYGRSRRLILLTDRSVDVERREELKAALESRVASELDSVMRAQNREEVRRQTRAIYYACKNLDSWARPADIDGVSSKPDASPAQERQIEETNDRTPDSDGPQARTPWLAAGSLMARRYALVGLNGFALVALFSIGWTYVRYFEDLHIAQTNSMEETIANFAGQHAELLTAVQANTAARAEFESLETEVGSLETEVGSLETEVGSLDTKVETEVETKVDAEVESLETRVGSLETEVRSLKTEVGSLDTKVETEVETKVDAEVESLETRVGSLETEVGSLDTKVETEVETKVDAEVESLETRVGSLETEVGSLDTKVETEVETKVDAEVESLETRVGSLETEVGSLKTEVGSLDTKVETEVETKVDAEVESLETRVGSLETEVGSLETEVGSLKTEVGSLDTKVETEVDAEVKSLETRVGSLETEVGSLKTEGETEVESLKTEVTEQPPKPGVIPDLSASNIEESSRITAGTKEKELGLSEEDRRAIQRGLKELGHHGGLIDGLFGNITRSAIELYQNSRGLSVTGYLDRDQADSLMAHDPESLMAHDPEVEPTDGPPEIE